MHVLLLNNGMNDEEVSYPVYQRLKIKISFFLSRQISSNSN